MRFVLWRHPSPANRSFLDRVLDGKLLPQLKSQLRVDIDFGFLLLALGSTYSSPSIPSRGLYERRAVFSLCISIIRKSLSCFSNSDRNLSNSSRNMLTSVVPSYAAPNVNSDHFSPVRCPIFNLKRTLPRNGVKKSKM
jgi:hypothetical protein